MDVRIACLGSRVKTDIQQRLDESNVPPTQRQQLRDALRLIPTCEESPIQIEEGGGKEDEENGRGASTYNKFTGACMTNPEKFDLETKSMSKCAAYWQEHKEELKKQFS